MITPVDRYDAKPVPRVRGGSRGLLRLAVLLWTPLVLLLLFPQESSLGLRWLRSKGSAVVEWLQIRGDPSVGTAVDPTALALPAMRDALAARSVGLIFVASCEGCAVASARQWSTALRTRGVSQLYVVSRVRPSTVAVQDLQLSCVGAGVQARFIWDRTGAVHRALHAFFLPRCYLFKAGGTLEWIQGIADDIPTTPSLPGPCDG